MESVVSGLDRWLEEGPQSAGLRPGARIAFLAHAASVDRRAAHAVERLAGLGSFRLVRLFAPEHGLWGRAQDMEGVDDDREPLTGRPVISLYGNGVVSLRPRAEHLADLDAIVVDVQDVGSRYYTFVYTMSYLMEAAAPLGLPVVVLDRPNPIGGERIEGPVLRPELASFVGRYPIPVRHGMTVGELAGLFNREFGIGCDLRVVEMRGWKRSMEFEATGLPWVPPSPNMPTVTTARVYPGGCLIEGTNLSEGRGTTTPFELVGAPWLDGATLASALRAEGMEGVLFRPAVFRPAFQKHAGQTCHGVQVIIEDPRTFRPFATYLVLLREVLARWPSPFEWRREVYEFERSRLAIDLLLGRSDLRSAIETGAPLHEAEGSWQADLAGFEALRKEYLIYR